MKFDNLFDYINYLQDRYIEKWGDYIMKEWILLDNYCFFWRWLKYILILETHLYTNAGSFIIKRFNKLPKKYEKMFFEDD